jgi:hypothetical protein
VVEGARRGVPRFLAKEVPNIGQNWQVDQRVFDNRQSPITLGIDGGRIRMRTMFAIWTCHFYVTEDGTRGALQRFTPDSPNWNDPWNILYGTGTTHFLLLSVTFGSDGYAIRGVFSWTTNEMAPRRMPNDSTNTGVLMLQANYSLFSNALRPCMY